MQHTNGITSEIETKISNCNIMSGFLWHFTDIHVVVLLHRSIFMSNLLRSCTLTRISDIVQVHVNKESLQVLRYIFFIIYIYNHSLHFLFKIMVHAWCVSMELWMHAGSWESSKCKNLFEWHEAKPSASLASPVLSQLLTCASITW